MPNAQTIASAKYNAKTYEEIKIRVHKGEKDRYKVAAEKLGVSVNQLFINAVEQFIADNIAEPVKDNAEDNDTENLIP